MKELQIYGNGRVFALVDEHGNYSINTKSESEHGYTGFQQGRSWSPVDIASAPAWLTGRIEDFDLFESNDEGE